MAVQKKKIPIPHWSYSSLMSYLRNPLAWYKRYVEGIRDTPSGPAAVVGRAGHKALEHFYSGIGKEGAVELGMEYLRNVPDFEINFGVSRTKTDKKLKRSQMERDYLMAVGNYLARPPRYDVLGIEVSATTKVPGLMIPIKAISDLVVKSKTEKGAVNIVDHKFVNAYSPLGAKKTLFVIQALFNYYTIKEKYGLPIGKFILNECKIRKNADGRPQMHRYVIDFDEASDDFALFHRLINDATLHLMNTNIFLPNPSDMFEGEDSFDIYRLGLINE